MKKILLLFLLIPLNSRAQMGYLVSSSPNKLVLSNLIPKAFVGENIQIIRDFTSGLNTESFHALGDSLVKSQEDSSKKRYSYLIIQKAAIPVILIGLGFAGSGKKPFLDYNEEIQEEIQEHYNGFHTKIDNYTRYAPIAMAYGLNIAGIKGEHNLVNLTCLFVLSDFINSATTKQLKGFTHQLRPDRSSFDAFPSGHTSGAFTGATILFLEYKDKNIWYGIGGYSFAVATGALRLLNNKHWFSDVLAGAGIGILSTQVAYAVYPWIQKQISQGIPKLSNKNMLITPTYTNSSLGLAMIYQLK